MQDRVVGGEFPHDDNGGVHKDGGSVSSSGEKADGGTSSTKPQAAVTLLQRPSGGQKQVAKGMGSQATDSGVSPQAEVAAALGVSIGKKGGIGVSVGERLSGDVKENRARETSVLKSVARATIVPPIFRDGSNSDRSYLTRSKI